MDKSVAFSNHALEQMEERGAFPDEVLQAVKLGEEFSAKRGRKGYRLNFPFGRTWGGRFYSTKQVVPIIAEDSKERIVTTVYVFYF